MVRRDNVRWTQPMKKLEVGSAAVEKLRRGHPWVWQRAVQRGLDKSRPGEDVLVIAPDGSVLGRAMADPHSPIAARIFRQPADGGAIERAPIDGALFAERVASALAV